MKKGITGILSIVYLLMVSGISLEKHYCMGKLASVDFFHADDPNERCGKCGMIEKNNHCCHDEHNFIKVDDTHKTPQADINIKAPVIELTPIHIFTYQESNVLETVAAIPVDFSPPDDTGPSLCIKNCVFRI